ncbi:MAG: DinB family protein [Acidobacteria bacterium]|nr:DinB family protein [Acidobacteriota bacterium]
MTHEEKSPSLDALRATRSRLIDLVGSLTAEQWNFHPAEGQWSVAEIAEHIVLVEKRVMSALKPTEGGTSPKRDSTITRVVPDRSTKVVAPAPVSPTGRFTTSSEWSEAFQEVRAQTIQWLESTEDPRAVWLNHFVFGPLDGYQWTLFASAHLERHLLQLDEIMQHPRFPA